MLASPANRPDFQVFLGPSSSGNPTSPSLPSLNLCAAQSCAAKATLSPNAFAMVKKMIKQSAAPSSGIPRRIHIEETSALIGKAETTIRTCATNKKYQHLIPPPFKLPGSRRLCWWEHEVLAWMESNRPVEPPPPKRPRGRPTKIEQLARARWQQRNVPAQHRAGGEK